MGESKEDQLIREATEEHKREQEENFKRAIKNRLDRIVSAQREIKLQQDKISKLGEEIKALKLDDVDSRPIHS